MSETAILDRRAILARSEVLRHLSAAQLDLLAQRCSVRRAAAGETLFERGTLRAHVGQRVALKEAAHAHAELEARRTMGATVLMV